MQMAGSSPAMTSFWFVITGLDPVICRSRRTLHIVIPAKAGSLFRHARA
jgi:hypothetical protein